MHFWSSADVQNRCSRMTCFFWKISGSKACWFSYGYSSSFKLKDWTATSVGFSSISDLNLFFCVAKEAKFKVDYCSFFMVNFRLGGGDLMSKTSKNWSYETKKSSSMLRQRLRGTKLTFWILSMICSLPSYPIFLETALRFWLPPWASIRSSNDSGSKQSQLMTYSFRFLKHVRHTDGHTSDLFKVRFIAENKVCPSICLRHRDVKGLSSFCFLASNARWKRKIYLV